MDIAALDRETAEKIMARCMTFDREGNGSHLDQIMIETLTSLGMVETVEAIAKVECWRA